MTLRQRDQRRVVACLFLILFVGVADNQILSPLLPAIRMQFGRSFSEIGLLFTGYSICAGLSVLIWGRVSDVFGRKRGLMTGLIVFCLGSCASYFSNGFYALLCGRILTGMGASMLSLNTISYAADFFPYENRGWAMGSIFSSYYAALVLGVPLGSWFGERYGWNSVFGVMALVSLILLISVQVFLRDLSTTAAQARRTPVVETIRIYAGFLKFPGAIGALMSSFFASAGTMGFLAFFGEWLHGAFGIPSSRIGLVFLIAGGAALLASPFAGAIADRIGKRLQVVVSSVALAGFLLLLPKLQWGKMMFLVFGLVSLAAAFRQGPMEAVLTEIVPSGSRGAFVALKNSFSQLGIGLATLMSGILFGLRGYGGVCMLGAAFCLLAAGSMSFTYGKRDL